MNLLIVGGSGHVSGALSRAAVAAGHSVWVVTRGKRPLPPGVTGLVADRQQPGSLESAIAAVAAGRSWDMVADCIAFDAPALEQDLALFRNRAGHLVFISTDFVYDPLLRRFPQPEEPACYIESETGASPYGFKKRRAEKVLLESETGSLAWTVLRPCHIYGPTSELGCLPLHGRDKALIEKLRAGDALKLAGGGHFLQQPILADDLALATLSVFGNTKARSRIFNAAGPDIVESRAYYRIIANVLGVELKVEELAVDGLLREHPDMAPFLCHRVYDRAAMREAGITLPSTPLVDGLRLHVEGLLARRAKPE
jgi:nucleoside-diphosphate-sugar epimerase